MKRCALIFVSVIFAVMLTSCYVMSVRTTGTINLILGGPAGRAISSTATVRVYLYSYSSSSSYSLYTFPNGAQYDSFQYGSGTATLSGIPTGLWEVLVSVGNSSNGLFSVTNYGDSGVINVLGGVDTPATINTKANPFGYSPTLAQTNITGVVFGVTGSYYLFASSASTLYEIPVTLGTAPDITTASATPISGLPSGTQINSLAQGDNQFTTGATPSVFVNTNYGIIPYYFTGNNDAFDTSNFSYALGPSYSNPYTIFSSTAVVPGSTSAQTGVAVYYSRPGGFGGVYLNGVAPDTVPFNATGGGAPWVDISVSSAGSSNPIYEMAPDLNSVSTATANSGFTYFAASFGAFRAATSLVDTSSASPGQLTSSNITYFIAPNNAPIHAVAVDDQDGIIYIGTTQGAYWATLNESSATSVISGSWTPIAATTGDDIVSIKVDWYLLSHGLPPEMVPVAMRSRSNNIYTLTEPPSLGGTVNTYPFYSGVPGTINEMGFVDGTLYLAGSEGLAQILVNPAIALG